MKLYTTPEQTAKLIELRFEKPRYECFDKTLSGIEKWNNIQSNYSIGELLSFLPNDFRDKNKNLHTLSIYTGELGTWEINYIGFESRIRTCEDELIDALYAMILQLQEEGVI